MIHEGSQIRGGCRNKLQPAAKAATFAAYCRSYALATVLEAGEFVVFIDGIEQHFACLTGLRVIEKYLDIALLFADFLKESKKCSLFAETERIKRD
jgi:hypothetical protein